MKKAFNIFFVVLGVIFLIILLIIALSFAGVQFGFGSIPIGNFSGGGGGGGGDKHPLMSPAQERALESFGIDPASVPSEISPEQEACFVEKLGQERVDEIKGGDTPTANDYFQAKSCV